MCRAVNRLGLDRDAKKPSRQPYTQSVCGESTAFGLLITRDRGSSSEEARVGPHWGGQPGSSHEEVNPRRGETPAGLRTGGAEGGGRRAGEGAARRGGAKRIFERKMKKM